MALKFSVYYYRSQTEIVAKLSWNMKMYKALIKVNMPLGQSILRLELLDVQCRGNLWQERPCLCPLLVSGVKRPNQRSWQVDRELQEWLWKKVLNLKHLGECALGPEHSASWVSRCSMPSSRRRMLWPKGIFTFISALYIFIFQDSFATISVCDR